MKLTDPIDWKKNWAAFLVLLLYIPAFWWQGIWSNGTVLRWWRACEGRVAAPVFFEWEEFIALHSHGNEYPGRLGFYLLIAVIVIFLLLELANIIRTQAQGFLLILLGFTLFTLFFSICLCQSAEKTNRRFCPGNLKSFHQVFENYIREYGAYPATLPTIEEQDDRFRPHLFMAHCNYIYPGANREPGSRNFVVVEDAPRAHAGDLRYRLWSDGTIDSYYPWQQPGGAK